MSTRTAAWVAWAMWGVAMLLAASGLVLLGLGHSTPISDRFGFRGFPAVFALTFATVGAIVASRRPENPIGWIFGAVGVAGGLQVFCVEYATYAVLTRQGGLPLGEAAAWLQAWMWVPAVGLVSTFLLLLFPDGRLVSRRWRPVAWLAVAATSVATLGTAFKAGPLEDFPPVVNPLGIEGAGRAVVQIMEAAGFVVLASAMLLSAASVFVRLRGAAPRERQQLKWFATAGAFAVIALAVSFTLLDLVPFLSVVVILGMASIPVAVAIGIFTYRLYDIDVVVKRTLVYGLLTATLVGTYFGSVVLLQLVFRSATGEGSSASIVVSTLGIAALFQPMRRRIQGIIDRRFYRRRYDAERTLAAFGVRMRDEVDLERVREALVSVVQETMQPANVSLWLRPAAGPEAGL